MKARKILIKGCIGYLDSIVDTTMKVATELSDVRVVCKFPDVFPDKLSGLPLDREIEIEIEFMLGTASISKIPYRMTLVELEELKQ